MLRPNERLVRPVLALVLVHVTDAWTAEHACCPTCSQLFTMLNLITLLTLQTLSPKPQNPKTYNLNPKP